MAERQDPSPRATQILAAARRLLEDKGPQALTMRAVADEVGIRAPSLYKHFPDKAALETALTAASLRETAEALEAAERAAPGSLRALTEAYRAYARAHPHLYRLATDRPLRRPALPDGVEDRASAPLLRAVGGEAATARAVWAFAHGMVLLELDGRFPSHADLDAAWERGALAFARPVP
ncbi:TetR/AcrR family transcriptional regulator [Streptomyces sp. CA-253872]|uniref:TetR/AcrR family transcriptional regulator n=1 Tax=Streptomyces sp. CA-253872 TaxID=3240067 RepID=UPI003D8FC2CB